VSRHGVLHKYAQAFRKIFCYIVDLILLNTYIIFSELNGKVTRTFVDFREVLPEEIIEECFTHGIGH
jgi:hypothetical protein